MYSLVLLLHVALVHRPTFVREYNEFWSDPYHVPMEWLALLVMILALGTFFSVYVAPHEVEIHGGPCPMDMYRQYRAAAGWALVAAKYTSPSQTKMQAFILYVAAEFMTNRASSANCYVLSSVGLRLMLQMGLHRDPDKLPNISPFEGEMRRRMWHLAVQIELLVSFHMGLPSVMNGLETDVHPQSNLTDDEIYPGMASLPTPRPDSIPTTMAYARWKSAICEIFGKIAAQTNSITVPSYGEVLRLDRLLNEKWKQVPSFMNLKSLQDSIADPPAFTHQRFGLASLYQKSRCVLHRRYIAEAIPKPEHAYSRRTCLEAALAMLEYQEVIHLATLPGGTLREHGWFLAAIATYDFLIAAMIVYVLHQSENYLEDEAYANWVRDGRRSTLPPSKDELLAILRRSHQIWVVVTQDSPSSKKAADILETMLKKIDEADGTTRIGGTLEHQGLDISKWERQVTISNNGQSVKPTPSFSVGSAYSTERSQTDPADGTAGYTVEPWRADFNQVASFSAAQGLPSTNDLLARQPVVPNVNSLDGTPWLDLGTGLNDVNWVSRGWYLPPLQI